VGRGGNAAMTMPILAITAWSLVHPVAVAANIDLNRASTPLKVNAPFGLLRTGTREPAEPHRRRCGLATRVGCRDPGQRSEVRADSHNKLEAA
jgi:hypothetical protein